VIYRITYSVPKSWFHLRRWYPPAPTARPPSQAKGVVVSLPLRLRRGI